MSSLIVLTPAAPESLAALSVEVKPRHQHSDRYADIVRKYPEKDARLRILKELVRGHEAPEFFLLVVEYHSLKAREDRVSRSYQKLGERRVG